MTQRDLFGARRVGAANARNRPIALPEDCDDAPSGWRWVPLSQVARLESGHTPSRRRPDWWGGNIPWLALPDIRALDGQTVYDTSERTNELGVANSAARI